MGNNSTTANKPTSQTLSRCQTESVTTAHNFEVMEYSLREGMVVGLCAWNFISSATFSVSGYGWNIRTYPDGFKKNKTAYLPVYLCFCSGHLASG
jgi:speckle-type POZ protein